jgi:hypothetical protein
MDITLLPETDLGAGGTKKFYKYLFVLLVAVLIWVWLNDHLQRKRFRDMEKRVLDKLSRLLQAAEVEKMQEIAESTQADPLPYDARNDEAEAVAEVAVPAFEDGVGQGFKFSPIFLGTQLRLYPLSSVLGMTRFRVIDRHGHYADVVADVSGGLQEDAAIHIRVFTKERTLVHKAVLSFEQEAELSKQLRDIFTEKKMAELIEAADPKTQQ